MNIHVVVGRLTQDITLQTSQNGTKFLRNTIAVQRKAKDSSGTYQTDFFQIAAFGKLAEIIAQFAHKGGMCSISGETHIVDSEKDDKKYRNVTIMVENFKWLEKITESNKSSDDDDPLANYDPLSETP